MCFARLEHQHVTYLKKHLAFVDEGGTFAPSHQINLKHRFVKMRLVYPFVGVTYRHGNGGVPGTDEPALGLGVRGEVNHASQPSVRASSAWYEIIKSAPARRMESKLSRTAAASSKTPAAAAALSMAYSPETL